MSQNHSIHRFIIFIFYLLLLVKLFSCEDPIKKSQRKRREADKRAFAMYETLKKDQERINSTIEMLQDYQFKKMMDSLNVPDTTNNFQDDVEKLIWLAKASSDPVVKTESILMLGGSKDKRALPVLEKALWTSFSNQPESNMKVQSAAATALGNLGPIAKSSVPALRHRLKDSTVQSSDQLKNADAKRVHDCIKEALFKIGDS